LQTVLLVIAIAGIAYVLAHYVVERLQARILMSSGVEYLILGLLLGPFMPWDGPIDEPTLRSLYPVMSLVIGALGLLTGLRANFRALLIRQDEAGQLAMTVFVFAGSAVGLGSWALLSTPVLGSYTGEQAMAGAAVLGASATVSSAGALALVQRLFKAEGALTRLLDGTMRAAELLAIMAFGTVFCVFHASDPEHADWTYANWLLVTLGLGVGLGALFRLFIGDRFGDDDQVFLAVLGIIVFASGAAYYLQLSPLLVTLILGMTLANVARCADLILATMERQQRTLSLMLLVMAGAMWRPIESSGWIVVLAYLLMRFGAKLLGGWAASASAPQGVPRDVGRGLLGHGNVAVAMAASFRLAFDGPVVDIAFTAILCSVVLSELSSARQLKGLLLDSGDIQPEGLKPAADDPPAADLPPSEASPAEPASKGA